MITYFLIVIFYALIATILSPLLLLPDVALDSQMGSSIATIGSYFGMIWSTIPLTLTALVASIVIIVVAENHIFFYKLIRWFYRKIPGVS